MKETDTGQDDFDDFKEKVKQDALDFEKKYQERLKRNKRKKMLLIILMVSIYSIAISLLLTKESYISKTSIKQKIITAINNNANLIIIKNIYGNRELVKSNFFTKLYKSYSKENYYPYNTPLSQILYDIQSDYYLKSTKAKINIEKIQDIIKNYSIVNPFDSLDSSQKDIFTNIRLKFSEKESIYKLIHNDLEKVAKELSQKNNLVNQYLKDSTNSFWISISALIFSAFIGLLQLFLAREDRHRQILSEELSKHKSDSSTNKPYPY